ncbi:MAG: MATE family efflux transporter [Candidatus Baltobacteraceae bacterium]
MFLSNVGALLRLAVPMIVSRAGLAAMAIVDAVMVSRYSSNQFAMLGLADGTLGRLSDVFGAFVMGGLVLVPRAFGAGNLFECANIWRRSLPPALGLGLAGALLGLTGAPLFGLLGQRASLASGAGTLTAIFGLGSAAALLALGAAVFLEGVKRPTIVAASVIAANLLNFGLNWLLIYGYGGLPALGARGSAISTTLVRFALAAALGVYAWKLAAASRPLEAGGGESAPQLQRKLSLASAAVAAVMLLLTASLTVFAGWLGPLSLALLAATFTLNAPVMLIALGVADATAIRVASADGAARSANREGGRPARAIVQTSVLATLAVLLAFAALWACAPQPLASIFTRDPAMREGLAVLIPLAGCLLVLDGICFIVVSALRALRDVVWPTGIELGTMAALVPLAAWLAFSRSEGVRGLILAAIASATARAALLVWRFLWLTKPLPGTARPRVASST